MAVPASGRIGRRCLRRCRRRALPPPSGRPGAAAHTGRAPARRGGGGSRWSRGARSWRGLRELVGDVQDEAERLYGAHVVKSVPEPDCLIGQWENVALMLCLVIVAGGVWFLALAREPDVPNPHRNKVLKDPGQRAAHGQGKRASGRFAPL